MCFSLSLFSSFDGDHISIIIKPPLHGIYSGGFVKGMHRPSDIWTHPCHTWSYHRVLTGSNHNVNLHAGVDLG